MSCALAVFAPVIGVRSETFIRRHIQDLMPGSTAIVAGAASNGGDFEQWQLDGPVLTLGGLNRTLEGGTRWLARKTGISVADMASRAVERFLKKHRVKAILGEYLNFSSAWLSVAQQSGIRFYGHAHGYDVSEVLRESKWRKEYLRYNQSDGVITVSHASKARLVDIGVQESKIHVIPCCVEVPPSPRQRPAHKKVRCLAVGRMTAKKAPIITLDAFRRALLVDRDLHLDYVGAGELFPAAQQYVMAFDLGKSVTLHRAQPREFVQQLMAASDIFLQHSMTDHETGNEEGLPVSVLEAMAHSLPVVSTRHAGIPEAVLDGATGCLVDEGDNVAMAGAIAALAADPQLRSKYGVAGWQRAREHFTWEKERDSLLKVMRLHPDRNGA